MTVVDNTSFNVWLYFTLGLFANIKLLGLFRAYLYSRFTRPAKPFPDQHQRTSASMLSRATNKKRSVNVEIYSSKRFYLQPLIECTHLVKGDV